MTSKLGKINLLIIFATFIILPIFALPITSDHVEIPKSFLIIISTTMAIFLATTNHFCGNYFLRLPSKIFLSLLALVELLLFTSLFKSQSVGTSLSSFNFWLLIFLPALFIIIGSAREKIIVRLEKITPITGIITAIIGTAFYLNSVNIIADTTQASIFFAIIIIFCLTQRSKPNTTFPVNPRPRPHLEGGLKFNKVTKFTCLILSCLSFLIFNPLTNTIFSSKMPQPLVLDFKTSSEIFFSTFRDFPLFGIGPDLYKTAFHLYKPLSFNQSQYAFLSFTQGLNFWLTLSTQYGTPLSLSLLSLFSLISLSIIKKMLFIGVDVPIRLSFLLLFASSFFLNLGPTLLYLLFFLAALNLPFEGKMPRAAVFILPVTALVVTIAVGINFTADIFYALAANGKSQKDETTFAFYKRAITLNPRNDVYRKSLAESYLTLATVLKNQKDLSALRRADIETLIKRSLVEAKAAVDLSPLESDNYRTAGLIYTNLIGAVTDAAGEGKRLLERAISLNPYDPLLRLDLASLYAANGQEETATDIIRGAIKLKGDYVSGRYQLSRLLVKLKKYREAKEEYRLTLNTIANRNSLLYQKIEKEMGEIH